MNPTQDQLEHAAFLGGENKTSSPNFPDTFSLIVDSVAPLLISSYINCFISKAIGSSLVKVASKAMIGNTLANQKFSSALPDEHLAEGDFSITAWINPNQSIDEHDIIVSKSKLLQSQLEVLYKLDKSLLSKRKPDYY